MGPSIWLGNIIWGPCGGIWGFTGLHTHYTMNNIPYHNDTRAPCAKENVCHTILHHILHCATCTRHHEQCIMRNVKCMWRCIDLPKVWLYSMSLANQGGHHQVEWAQSECTVHCKVGRSRLLQWRRTCNTLWTRGAVMKMRIPGGYPLLTTTISLNHNMCSASLGEFWSSGFITTLREAYQILQLTNISSLTWYKYNFENIYFSVCRQ